jgi:hypothetical protein
MKILTCMKRDRAQRLPASSRADILDWDIFSCGDHLHVELTVPGYAEPIRFAMEPGDGQDMYVELGRALDRAIGI